jgi:hypothetical protein
MAKIGETVSESDLEEIPHAPSEPSVTDKLKTVLEHLKKGELMKAGAAFPGTPQTLAAMTGALGPAIVAAPALAALVPQPGSTYGQRFKAAQEGLATNLNQHPLAGAAGGLVGGAALPLPSIPGGASVLGKTLAGAGTGALYGGAQGAGLGSLSGAAQGAGIGGAIGGAGGLLGGLISKAASSDMLNPTLNRLKFLKPSPEEAQPLSEAGQNIRGAIEDTASQGLWKGLPSREGMLERLSSAQKGPAQDIGNILQKADQVNASLPERVMPGDNAFANSQSKLQELLSHAASSGDNPMRLQNIAEQEGQNVSNAWSARNSLADLNKAKQSIYQQTYTPNKPEMGENFLPGRDQLLRTMGRDVKESIVDTVNRISQIDPSVDARGLQSANEQYGKLSDLIGPLNRAAGKELAGSGNAHLYGGPTHIGFSMLGDVLNFGGKRQLAQAHLGEFAKDASNQITKFKPAQSVAKAFIAGTTPGINEEREDDYSMQP